jgi:hypothetical protein
LNDFGDKPFFVVLDTEMLKVASASDLSSGIVVDMGTTNSSPQAEEDIGLVAESREDGENNSSEEIEDNLVNIKSDSPVFFFLDQF